jgi:hypothetical protein
MTYRIPAYPLVPPAPRTRKWLIDSIVDAFRGLVTERNALRRVLYNITTGVIGRTVDAEHHDTWYHMCGFIHGPTLEAILKELHQGSDPECQVGVAEELAAVEAAMKDHK